MMDMWLDYVKRDSNACTFVSVHPLGNARMPRDDELQGKIFREL